MSDPIRNMSPFTVIFIVVIAGLAGAAWQNTHHECVTLTHSIPENAKSGAIIVKSNVEDAAAGIARLSIDLTTARVILPLSRTVTDIGQAKPLIKSLLQQYETGVEEAFASTGWRLASKPKIDSIGFDDSGKGPPVLNIEYQIERLSTY